MTLAISTAYPDRRAFITGSASGLGLALAHLLASDGWTLGLADLHADGLHEAAAIVKAAGGTPYLYPFDVSDALAFRAAAGQFVEEAGGVDLVVNNAGIGVGGAFEETPIADWHAAIEINLLGVVHGCHAFLPHLKEAGGGHLLNVASAAAYAAGPYMAAYNTSKAGVLALSETLYSEVKDAGIGVSVLMPTFFKTPIAKGTRGGAAARAMTQTLIDRSDVTADEVARIALKATAEGTLHILYPRDARLAWHWKRLLPMHYLNNLVGRARSTAKFIARLTES